MITEGEAAILLETTRRAFRNQSQSKQRSTLKISNLLKIAQKLKLSHLDPNEYIRRSVRLMSSQKQILENCKYVIVKYILYNIKIKNS